MTSESPPTTPTRRIERAISDAADARRDGRHRDALDRLTSAYALVGTGPVRRALRVALHGEMGLAQLGLDRPKAARAALEQAFQQADGEPTLMDPVLASLATVSLMAGDAHEAERWLAQRGRDRRGTLLALARTYVFRGEITRADQALQACDQAPGAAHDGAPPTSALRSFTAIWSGRADQARMLYDGVSSPGNPYWDLVRLAILRAGWVAGGDARYLQLALGAAEQARFGESAARLPGFQAAAAAHHAVLLMLTGDLRLAAEAADAAMAQLGETTLPEWPRQAILHDVAVVYRDAGRRDAWQRAIDAWDLLDPGPWRARMAQITGPRAAGALDPPSLQALEGTAAQGATLGDVALTLFDTASTPHVAALRALCERVGALGATWGTASEVVLAKVGATPASDASDVRTVLLDDGSRVTFAKPQPAAMSQLDVGTLDRLAAACRQVAGSRSRISLLQRSVESADVKLRQAEAALEQTRRPGSHAILGGRFQTVVGRSRALTAVLDRLAALHAVPVPVLLDGEVGSGRRHLAQAFAALDKTDVAASPVLDVSLVPPDQQISAMERLLSSDARQGFRVIASTEHLTAEACSWLIQTLDAPVDGVRVALTLDAETVGPTAQALRTACAAGHVKVPGLGARLEDLPMLIDHFAKQAGRRPEDIGTAARSVIARRVFVGHLAELRAFIVQGAIRAGDRAMLPEHFEAKLPGATTHLSESIGLGYHDAVRDFRKKLLRHALGLTGGNRTRAAELLGLQRTYFMRLIRELGAADIPAASAS